MFASPFPKFLGQFNPLMDALKPQSNGPLYSNTMIDTLTVDGWAVTLGTTRRGLLSPLLAVPDVTAHPSTVCTNFILFDARLLMSLYIYLYPLKG